MNIFISEIKFVKAGMPTSSRKSKPTGLLNHTRDWLFMSDLDSGFIFLGHIAITSLRPDLIVFSISDYLFIFLYIFIHVQFLFVIMSRFRDCVLCLCIVPMKVNFIIYFIFLVQ